MKTLPLRAVAPGMHLADDVRTPDGRLLLPGGTPLAAKHLELLARRGIEKVVVRESGVHVSARSRHQGEEHARGFFLYVDHADPFMNALYAISAERTAQRIAEGWTPPVEGCLRGDADHLPDQFLRGEGQPEDIVDAECEVASFSGVYGGIQEVLASGTASAGEIADIVTKDVALTAKLLKIVNSPFYGFARRIDTISRAVTMVGGRELSTLAMGVSAVSAFQGVPPELIDMTAFWRHSLSVGLLAKLLATHCGDRAPERFFTAGLLHDVGRLILFKRLPQASVDVLRYARGACVPLVDAEEAVMGFTHARVGGLLLAAWGFPESLEMAARLHHGPVEGEHDFTAMVVHVADNIANALAIAQGSQFALPGAASGAWERLGTPVESLEEICREHDEQLEAIFGAFFG